MKKIAYYIIIPFGLETGEQPKTIFQHTFSRTNNLTDANRNLPFES
jgi:hypothetical protein